MTGDLENALKPTYPQFTGSYADFHAFIGPYLRNVVQNLTRPHKKKASGCEHCGDAEAKLDAAHRRGHERPAIARGIIQPMSDDALISVDLTRFMEQFVAAHTPIEKAIVFLCKPCHVQYDSASPTSVRNVGASGARAATAESLPITLSPTDHD